jgi:hypothetical protein
VGAPQSRSSPARIRRSTCGTTLLSKLVVQPLLPQDCSCRHRRRSRPEHRPAGRDPRPPAQAVGAAARPDLRRLARHQRRLSEHPEFDSRVCCGLVSRMAV